MGAWLFASVGLWTFSRLFCASYMPPLSYASNTVNEQSRAAANRLWDPAAAPDLKPKIIRMPKKSAAPCKQPSPIQPRMAGGRNVFPDLPRVPPPARNVAHRQSIPEVLSEKLALQQELSPRPQSPALQCSPTLRAPSPPSPRADVRRRRPSSASVTHGVGIVPDPRSLASQTDESTQESPAADGPAASSAQESMPTLVSPCLQVPQQEASVSPRAQLSGSQAPPAHQPPAPVLASSSPRSTRASGSGRHILARSVRLRTEGTTFTAHCSEAPSMWGAAALTRNLGR